jgi:DNA-binding CsgD family transcriptional regulator
MKDFFGIVPEQACEALAKLTPRELEYAGEMAMGHDFRDIAERLGIARKTGDIHRYKIKEKLGCTVAGVARLYFASKFAKE